MHCYEVVVRTKISDKTQYWNGDGFYPCEPDSMTYADATKNTGRVFIAAHNVLEAAEIMSGASVVSIHPFGASFAKPVKAVKRKARKPKAKKKSVKRK